jgi:hypothetical protein
MLTSKNEMVREIYGPTPPFSFDTALPQDTLDMIAESISMAGYGPMNDVPGSTQEFEQEVYATILSGTVYAYGRRMTGEGFVPLTEKARHYLRLYSEIVGRSVIFTPVLKQ